MTFSFLRAPALLVALGCSLLAACDGSGGGGDHATKATALEACEDSCDAAGNANGCLHDPSLDVPDCKQRCASIVPALDQACLDKAAAAFVCGASADWVCEEFSEYPGPGSECEAEYAASAPCIKQAR
jgi:hypothetical protein